MQHFLLINYILGTISVMNIHTHSHTHTRTYLTTILRVRCIYYTDKGTWTYRDQVTFSMIPSYVMVEVGFGLRISNSTYRAFTFDYTLEARK